MRTQYLIPIIFCAAISASFFLTHIVFAQVDTAGIEEAAAIAGVGTESPAIVMARIIRALLGLLGIVVVGLTVYGGFMYMTAAGSEEKVAAAKKILLNAGVGLVIVVAAFAIVQFVLSTLLKGLAPFSEDGLGPGGAGGAPAFGGGYNTFAVKISPKGKVPAKNIAVDFLFHENLSATKPVPIDPGSAAYGSEVRIEKDGALVDGTIVAQANLITFTPAADCAEAAGEKCFEGGATYLARIKGGTLGVRAKDGRVLNCDPECSASFTVGDLVDTKSPTVQMTSPYQNQGVPVDSSFTTAGSASDDAAVQKVEVFAGGASLGFAPGAEPDAQGNYPKTLAWQLAWDTAGLTIFSNQELYATAYDFSGHTGFSSKVKVKIVGAHCANGLKDADESGTDCGGKSCLSCEGGSCSTNAQCASGLCEGGQCVGAPVITGIDPTDGAPQTVVTITGKGFGNSPGQVIMQKSGGGTVTIHKDSYLYLCLGKTQWFDTYIIFRVPSDAADGSLEVVRPDGKKDSTADGPGPALPDFDVNDVLRPAIGCWAPLKGAVNAPVQVTGSGFGVPQGTSKILVGGVAAQVTGWNPTFIGWNVPNIAKGTYPITVNVQGVESNGVPFTVESTPISALPKITNVNPQKGSPGTTITITGSGFGEQKGVVYFVNSSGEAPAEMSFPAQCTQATWNSNSVTVKVPQVADGLRNVYVQRVSPTAKSNEVKFEVMAGPVPAGLCAVSPDNGPVGASVSLFGEHFGAAKGSVAFSQNKIVDANTATGVTWSDGDIKNIKVPQGAETGTVKVQRPEGGSSNALPFLVVDCRDAGCATSGATCCVAGTAAGACVSAGEQCPGTVLAAAYAWTFATSPKPIVPTVVEQCGDDLVPSPAPSDKRPGGTEVCVNAKVSVVFSTRINPATVTDASVIAEKCVGTGGLCDTVEKFSMKPPEVITVNETQNGFFLLPSTANGLFPVATSTYRVTLTTAITSDKGVPMQPKKGCLREDAAHCFTFTTKNSPQLCDVNDVLVTPTVYTAKNFGTVLDTDEKTALAWNASPVSSDVCILLNPQGYPWSWDTSDQTRATPVPLETEIHKANAQALKETAAGAPVKIIAATPKNPQDPGAGAAQGSSELTIALPNPKVVTFWPNCQSACVNAAIGASFNVPMDGATLNVHTIKLHRCFDESCTTLEGKVNISNVEYLYSPPDAGASQVSEVRFVPALLLKQKTFYRVIVRGGDTGVKSKGGATLTGVNYGEHFSWSFGTGTGDVCKIASITVQPASATASVKGEKVEYASTPKGPPDACDPKGQKLNPHAFNWKWTSVDTKVATVTNYDRGAFPAWCTQACKLTGSVAYTAVCGDSALGYGEECDVAFGQPFCSTTCLRTGATAVSKGGTCGNAKKDNPQYKSSIVNPWIDAEKGEECDDGNEKDGDGCGGACLNEGASAGGSICGNGAIGPGEDCDDGNTASGDGCSGKCLWEGAPSFDPSCANVTLFSSDADKKKCAGVIFAVCGNAKLESGEGCDDGNSKSGDGCASNCLSEQTVAVTTTAVCGDGTIAVAAGEQCDPPIQTDNKVDPFQEATAVGQGAVDTQTGLQSTHVSAQELSSSVKGVAAFALQCGFKTDQECAKATGRQIADVGVGANSCCGIRPLAKQFYPAVQSKNVCRNTAVWAIFNELMDPATFTGNIYLAEEVPGSTTVCPIDGSAPQKAWVAFDGSRGARGFTARLRGAIRLLLKVFVGTPLPAEAAYQASFCPSAVKGTLEATTVPDPLKPDAAVTKVTFKPAEILAPKKHYALVIKGTTVAPGAYLPGLKAANGVALWNSYLPRFETGTEICTLDGVTMSPPVVVMTKANESRVLEAAAQTKSGQEIVPVAGTYEWSWDWSLATTPADIASVGEDADAAGTVKTIQTVQGKTTNGEGSVTVAATITEDKILKQSTKGASYAATAPLSIFVCENPWPSRENNNATFADTEEASYTSGFVDLSGGKSPPAYTNFSTRYCRDQGAPGTADDLPELAPIVIGTPPDQPDIAQGKDGTLKEFFFKVTAAGSKDTIGVRVLTNHTHKPLLLWYLEQGFKGAPQAATIQGLEALVDGRTTYVGAPNAITGSPVKELYTNVYVFSYNQGAAPETIKIINQMIAHLKLMTNVEDQKLCFKDSSGDGVFTSGQEALGGTACTNDAACAAGELCSVDRTKILRDLRRIYDLNNIVNKVETHKLTHGAYPTLDAGTFVLGFTNSKWPSWQSALGNTVGMALPSDPLDVFLACPEGYEQDTCWKPSAQSFICPAGSHVYVYQKTGEGYTVGSDFEFKGGALWKPQIMGLKMVSVCTGAVQIPGDTCGDGLIGPNEQCEAGQVKYVAPNTECANGSPSSSYEQKKCACTAQCTWTSSTETVGKCGDSIIQTGEVCDDGAKNGLYGQCASDCKSKAAFCGDGVIGAPEVCETARCKTITGSFVDPPILCQFDANCAGSKTYGVSSAADQAKSQLAQQGCTVGNTVQVSTGSKFTYNCGTCDKFGTRYAKSEQNSCNWDCKVPGPFCGDGVESVEFGEACDPGVTYTQACTTADGTVGTQTRQCKSDCSAFAGAWSTCTVTQAAAPSGPTCGDGQVQTDLGEECDLGAQNGAPCTTEYGKSCTYCTSDCKKKSISGGFCGDGQKNGSEACDAPDFSGDTCTARGFDYGTLTCTTACLGVSDGSCKKCAPNNGDGSITGQFKNAYTNAGIGSNGFVQLLYKNKMVANDTASQAGEYEFSTLGTDAACTYKVNVQINGFSPAPFSAEEKLSAPGTKLAPTHYLFPTIKPSELRLSLETKTTTKLEPSTRLAVKHKSQSKGMVVTAYVTLTPASAKCSSTSNNDGQLAGCFLDYPWGALYTRYDLASPQKGYTTRIDTPPEGFGKLNPNFDYAALLCVKRANGSVVTKSLQAKVVLERQAQPAMTVELSSATLKPGVEAAQAKYWVVGRMKTDGSLEKINGLNAYCWW